jgi:hypothetical protein
MPRWYHASMQNTGDQNAIGLLTIKDYVTATFHTPQTRANLPARSSQERILSKPLAASFDFVQISLRLCEAPGTQRVLADAEQVRFGKARKTNNRQELFPFSRKVKRLSNSREHISSGKTADVSFVDGRAQSSQLSFILPLFTI